jgi:formylglycine-generating enzyme required for sulfatase activity
MADVPGSFVYTPSIGTSLNEGDNQELKVDFTPADAVNYNKVSKSVKINVFKPIGLQYVNIPAGTFTMGSPTSEENRQNDERQHSVNLSAFRMSKYEITNAQYAAFLNAKGIGSDALYVAGAYPTKKLIYASGYINDWGLHYTNNQWVPVVGFENHPVIFVTWYGATEFSTYAGGTLPTEAQWEYACRGGTTTPFNTGIILTNLQANYNVYPIKTKAVGSYPANAYGLHDMHGNVIEWCSDFYDDYPRTTETDPSGPLTGSYRVYRGGGFNNLPEYCRSASRFSYLAIGSPEYGNLVFGFRVVLAP